MVELKPDERRFLVVFKIDPGIVAEACGSRLEVCARLSAPAPAVKAELVHDPCL